MLGTIARHRRLTTLRNALKGTHSAHNCLCIGSVSNKATVNVGTSEHFVDHGFGSISNTKNANFDARRLQIVRKHCRSASSRAGAPLAKAKADIDDLRGTVIFFADFERTRPTIFLAICKQIDCATVGHFQTVFDR